MSSSPDVAQRVRTRVWNGSIPLRIQLHPSDCATYDASTPYLVQFPRLSYLALHLDKLHAFFARALVYPHVAPTACWLSYQGVPLRWHFPLGLLYDLYAGADPTHDAADADNVLPWTLTAHFSDYPASLVPLDAGADNTLHDLYRNAVKEADYLRTGTAKTVMFLSEKDSTQLWDGVRTHDLALFAPVNAKLLNPQGAALRNLPLRLYLPHAQASTGDEAEAEAPASLRVVQGLVPMKLGSRRSILSWSLVLRSRTLADVHYTRPTPNPRYSVEYHAPLAVPQPAQSTPCTGRVAWRCCPAGHRR
jgi:autophagy-related protein 5